MKTTEKNSDSIVKRSRCMIFAHYSYRSIDLGAVCDKDRHYATSETVAQIMVLLGRKLQNQNCPKYF